MDPIRFEAAVAKVQTLADGGLRVTFDLGESAIEAVALLMACKRAGVYLSVTCEAQERGDDGGGNSTKLKF